MKCPYCGYTESKVVDSRPTDESERIRRRRECLKCSKRFTTYEVIESVPIVVIKKDKSREAFDRQKLLTGLLRACEKRPVSLDTLEHIVGEIEVLLQNSLDKEVSSQRIGTYAMEKLKSVDEVAYVRFGGKVAFHRLLRLSCNRKEMTDEVFYRAGGGYSLKVGPGKVCGAYRTRKPFRGFLRQ